MAARTRTKKSVWARHGLSLTVVGVLALLTALYVRSDPGAHWGSFFGNAIADWTGLLVTIVATKYLREIGSVESKKVRKQASVGRGKVHEFLHEHSLLVFLLITGVGWVTLFIKMSPTGKWGQVVGNIVSEWTQVLATVMLTKWLLEVGSKESRE